MKGMFKFKTGLNVVNSKDFHYKVEFCFREQQLLCCHSRNASTRLVGKALVITFAVK
jgi:hypothetical protein